MAEMTSKIRNKALRKSRVRARISGTASRPRLSVFISNSHVSAQIIDDDKGQTLASSTSIQNSKATGNLTQKAAWVGNDVAEKALAGKIKQVVFDRNGRKYHGRVKALADAARAKGLEF